MRTLSYDLSELGTNVEVLIIRLSRSMIAEWSIFFGDLPLEVLLPLEALLTVTDLVGVLEVNTVSYFLGCRFLARGSSDKARFQTGNRAYSFASGTCFSIGEVDIQVTINLQKVIIGMIPCKRK